ncbi:uncharacterized protein V1510DRAFT_419085 [Dipodascopsis tothii]|uniref:uncharacterized protein n=1 Tax=Dipodascopsis tothii TaxID=44089 RepID=UPI0034CF966F
MRPYTIFSIIFIFAIATASYYYVATSKDGGVAEDAVSVAATDASDLKSYIVTFKKGKGTPEKVVQAAMDKIKALGGHVTHEYDTVLKGFAVTIPATVVSAFESRVESFQNADFPFVVEEDRSVNIN